MLKLLICILFFIQANWINSQVLIKTNIAAKVNNEVILISDVKKTEKLYGISFEEARKMLIEDALLYIGAKISTEEPTEEEIVNQIKDDKAFYAMRVNKDVKNVSEQEFLNALLTNNISMKTYKDYVKKQLWITKFINSVVDYESTKYYFPSEKEMEELVKSSPEMFEEKEGANVSMVYFSFFDKDGNPQSEIIIKEKKKLANECLEKLMKGHDFEDVVLQYSDDLISVNNDPSGFVGAIPFDDPRTEKSLSKEIIESLKKSNVGLISEIFTTENGCYIFKIESKIKPRILSQAEINQKADHYLRDQYKKDLRDKTRNNLITDLSEKFEVKTY